MSDKYKDMSDKYYIEFYVDNFDSKIVLGYLKLSQYTLEDNFNNDEGDYYLEEDNKGSYVSKYIDDATLFISEENANEWHDLIMSDYEAIPDNRESSNHISVKMCVGKIPSNFDKIPF